MPVVYILLDGAGYSFDIFIDNFRKKWQLQFEPHREEDSLGMIIDGRIVGCTIVPYPIVESALIKYARENMFWPEAEACVAKHKAHLKVAIAREGDPVAAHTLLSKVIYSLLQQRNALCVYLKPGLIEPSYYIKCAEELVKKKLPTELWVHINSTGSETGDSFSFNTVGMNKFGKKEFEIKNTKKNFIDAYYCLKEQIKATIENDIKK